MINLKSKSDPNAPNLIDHSILTARISAILFDICDRRNDIELKKCAYYAGLFHDIGKATYQFQNILSNNKDESEHIDENEENKKIYKYLHNEIGWAFLCNKIDYFHNNNNYSDFILNNVYYSHGIYNIDTYKSSDIIDNLTPIDKSTIEELYNYLLNLNINSNYVSNLSENIDIREITQPDYYLSDKNLKTAQELNNKMLYIRSIVRYADALASSNIFNVNDSDDIIRDYIINSNKAINSINIENCGYFNTSRFNKQLEVSEKIERTTIVKAPTGYGKTLVGLLWFAKHKQKILWVCPTNNLSYGIYKSILKELKLFGDNKVSVQLYLTNEVKESNCDCPDFEADIVITNLDNYLKPNIDASYGSRLYNVYNRRTVFDEIQEYITETPLFACFISTMNIRHKYTNTETLCLSATPSLINSLWEYPNGGTTILPNTTNHYKSFINQNITLKHNTDLSSDIIISNSVRETQEKKTIYNKDLIIHSKYLDIDKKNKMDNILNVFGEQGKNDRSLSSSLIIQSGFDISTKNMADSILSPESTLQRIGRIDRWGNKNGGTYNFELYDIQGENKVTDILYDKNLRDKWFNYLLTLNGVTISLDDLYIFYNNFVSLHNVEISKFIKERYDKSLDNLYNITYNKPNPNKIKNGSINANGNKLRSGGNEIFCLFKDENGNWLNEAINCKVYYNNYWDGGTKDQKELNAYFNMVKKELKKLLNNTNFNFGKKLSVTRLNKLKGVDTLRKMAINSKTPYLRFDSYYDSDLGIIKNN